MIKISGTGGGPSVPRLTVAVTCPACEACAVIRSRSEFSTFEETHVQSCLTFATPTDGSFDDLLGLPPY